MQASSSKAGPSTVELPAASEGRGSDALLKVLARHAALVVGAARSVVVVEDGDGQRRLAAEHGFVSDPQALDTVLDRVSAHESGRFGSQREKVLTFDQGVIWLDGITTKPNFKVLSGLVDLAGTICAAAHERERLARGANTAVGALASLLELRDGYAAIDGRFMVDLTERLGRRLGLDTHQLEHLATAARLHDVGKIGVPDRILHKRGPLDAQERLVVQRHPEWGAEALANVPTLQQVAAIVRMHHERVDGSGYPAGIGSPDIPTESMIIAVAETFRALTSERPYRNALAPGQALTIISSGSGTHFDPAVVRALRQDCAERGITPTAARSRTPRSRGQAVVTTSPGGRPGHRMPAAFERLEGMPALTESRDRLIEVLEGGRPTTRRLVSAIESDLALAIAVLRVANQQARPRSTISNIPQAVAMISPDGVKQLALRISVVDFFEQLPGWPAPPERMRLHAVSVKHVAASIARTLDPEAAHDDLLVAALLHDVGKLLLADAYPGYPQAQHGQAQTPDARAQAERHELGLDHATVGGVLIRRWGLPNRLASIVENHHKTAASGAAGIVRLADLLAHYAHGQDLEPHTLQQAAATIGLSHSQLRTLMYERDAPSSGDQQRIITSECPLSPRELAVVRELATGKVYGEIANALSLSSSTVRTHLHNTYRKLGVQDRAQAVLLCAEQGWI
ncbi:HDOD domain-containing protein [Baekduia soli]|uniref:HDOD domain-containing protein n=1 Tax=Baekduia soli TaxID=496014 RepID=A0A5B8U631_9ACTN|nr:HD domain-containing phosphohydrolase [Baekduia soli]QEC48576.1 HDOD domain-containing protein [Baekduia soli]